MTPSRVSASLRQIADKIDRSQKPSRRRVNAAIRRVLAAMGNASYLLFTSASSSGIFFEVSTPQGLEPLVSQYNSPEAYEARGGDGTAYLLDEAGLLQQMEASSMDEIQSMDDGGFVGKITAEQAKGYLDGTVDPFTGE